MRILLLIIFVVQAVSAGWFVSDILASVLGLRMRPIPWELRELLEVLAAVGLVLGLLTGLLALVFFERRARTAQERLRLASAAFAELVQTRLDDWGLTPAERDVALFLIKGLTIEEIANLRGTSEGTVKAQTSAIYRKAGVSGRYQLLAELVEDMAGGRETVAVAAGGQAG